MSRLLVAPGIWEVQPVCMRILFSHWVCVVVAAGIREVQSVCMRIIKIPNLRVGAILGPGGAHVKTLQVGCGCWASCMPPGAPGCYLGSAMRACLAGWLAGYWGGCWAWARVWPVPLGWRVSLLWWLCELEPSSHGVPLV